MKNTLFVFVILLFFACKNDSVEKGILSKTKMTRILIDIHIAEAKVNQLAIANRDTSSAIYVQLQDKVLKKHKVTKKNYIQSFKYYNSNPAEMDKIYTAVIDSLNLRQVLLKL